MCFETLEPEQVRLPRSSTDLQDPHSRNRMMDVRTMTNNADSRPLPRKGPYTTTTFIESRKIDYQRSFSQGSGRKMFSKSYFSLESLFILICLTASLLVLPLILPPLPPPPFMLLLLPICLLVVLVFLAFMPSNIREVAYT